jgi:hypothetical protein
MSYLDDIGSAIGGYLQNVLSGQVAAQGMQNTFGNYYDPNRSFAANATDPRGIANAANLAMGFSGGGLGTKAGKAASAAASDLPAPNIGKGTATPLFDLSNLAQRPNVPQTPIARMPPPANGVPQWFVDQIKDPATAQQYQAILQRGRQVAGDNNALGWWNTMPLRDRTIGEFGPQQGDAAWRSDMNMLSATSPRSNFPTNINQASYFGNLLASGQDLPELVKKYQTQNPNAFNLVPATGAPPGYKNFPLHIQNIGNLMQRDPSMPYGYSIGNDYPLTNPKPASMAQNLVGNWSVPTIDVRDLRAMGAKYKNGKAMESVDPASLYGYTEQNFHQPLAQKLNLDPAQMQSTTWVGVPSYFDRADMSGTNSALGTLDNVIRQTAALPPYRGMTPEQVFQRAWLRKEFPLKGATGGS